MSGINGYRCSDCSAEWNSMSPESLWTLSCPNCISEQIVDLKRTVPFCLNDGLPPDHVYHCICGKIFQQQPDTDFNPYVKDMEKVKKQLSVQCPFCKRKNYNELSWYVP